eukprot:TRINITY_DN1700_c0_g2_i1.p1 TRINITY_DN1700_c0_g2~~TRINITY_DN1700_c0_g2_i1.p1  ORF type:complete len:618 (+),score=200.34 TRINITY_DN1700_c0_g2_i1:51-1904(+)
MAEKEKAKFIRSSTSQDIKKQRRQFTIGGRRSLGNTERPISLDIDKKDKEWPSPKMKRYQSVSISNYKTIPNSNIKSGTVSSDLDFLENNLKVPNRDRSARSADDLSIKSRISRNRSSAVQLSFDDGFLWRSDNGNSGWKKRFCRIDPNCLMFYKPGENYLQATPLNSIDLTEIQDISVSNELTNVEKDKYVFQVALRTKIQYFYVQNKLERENWIGQIQTKAALSNLSVLQTGAKSMKGTLYKDSPKKGVGKQERWFVLEGVLLTYYKPAKDKAAGIINLSGLLAVTKPNKDESNKTKFKFIVNTTSRKYTLYASSSEERDKWMKAIQANSKLLSNSFQNETSSGLKKHKSKNDILLRPVSSSSAHIKSLIFNCKDHDHDFTNHIKIDKEKEKEKDNNKNRNNENKKESKNNNNNNNNNNKNIYNVVFLDEGESSDEDENYESDEEDEDIIKAGFLYKSGGHGIQKKFQKRWFTATTDNICYYKSKKDENPKGIIPLTNITSINVDEKSKQKKKYFFEIKTPHRTYTLYSLSDEDRKDWYESVKPFIKDYSSKPLAKSPNSNNSSSSSSSKNNPSNIQPKSNNLVNNKENIEFILKASLPILIIFTIILISYILFL